MNLERRKWFKPIVTCKTETKRSLLALTETDELKGTARLRDACVSLTLLYQAYAVHSHLDWLGALTKQSEQNRFYVRWCIRRPMPSPKSAPNTNPGTADGDTEPVSLCDPSTVRQVALALEDIRPLYEVPDDPDDLIDALKPTVPLLLVDRSPRQVFWKGQPIADGKWDSSETQWNLLWTLARSSGRIVDQGMLQRPESQKMASRRSRLAKLLAETPELDARVSNQRGQGYRLDLSSEDVILLQDDGTGRLNSVGAPSLRTL